MKNNRAGFRRAEFRRWWRDIWISRL